MVKKIIIDYLYHQKFLSVIHIVFKTGCIRLENFFFLNKLRQSNYQIRHSVYVNYLKCIVTCDYRKKRIAQMINTINSILFIRNLFNKVIIDKNSIFFFIFKIKKILYRFLSIS